MKDSLPYRQLRNDEELSIYDRLHSLPYRQLRKHLHYYSIWT